MPNARTRTATTAPAPAEATSAPVEATSGYEPELRQRVWLPGAAQAARSGETRLKRGLTRDRRRSLSWTAAKRGDRGYGPGKVFLASNGDRFGPLADQLWTLAVQHPEGCVVDLEAFEVTLGGEQELTAWRVTSAALAERAERVDRAASVEEAWADMPAPAPAAPAKAAGAWNAPPADLDTEVPF